MQPDWHFPAGNRPYLDMRTTQRAVVELKEFFARQLTAQLGLSRVLAPLVVPAGSGLNDTLSGVEPPVAFTAGPWGNLEVVQSLAKWKRAALGRYGFSPGEGLFAEMHALRPGELVDNLHSLHVDQWDWERVIHPTERTPATFRAMAVRLYQLLRETELEVHRLYPQLRPQLPADLVFVTAQELEDRLPAHSPAQREAQAAHHWGAVCITSIGDTLASGQRHGLRAPDYDDWTLNGDIILWCPLLGQPMEWTSMGIRVDGPTLKTQLAAVGCRDWVNRPFHQALLRGELPLTMGGGIGVSRTCMFLLQKVHIGEVQAAVWPSALRQACAQRGIWLL